mgnify:CR=1 FL=1|tara:strand:- start:224 stop:433 length:210 start_codon:yes stop_codon:yes gene_type:complete
MSEESYKDRIITMILDNGMSLTLAVCTIVAIYMIMHQYNQILIETVAEMKRERIEITTQLIDCYKYKED